MKNGETSILSSEGEIANTTTCAPKVENGVMTLNNTYATSECSASIKNAIIKHETTTDPPTTATLGQFGRISFGENGHAFAAITDEPGSFFNDYWWIFLIPVLIVVAVGIGIGVCCYLRRKKTAQKPIPARRLKLQGIKSTVVSTEAQKCKTEN
uniref:Uncharacterized protein n=1 Tax=Panagrolaimus sp. PS1159 TaxID=55785 RepID=A0AC35GSP8_9BILA